MMEKIYDGSIHPVIFRFARDAAARVPEFDDLGEIRAVSQAVKRRVRFVRDPYRIEALQDADDTLTLGSGDCDDLAILAGAALQSVGVPIQLEVVGMSERPSHVYLTAKSRTGQAIPIDLARPDRRFFSPQPDWMTRNTYQLSLASAIRRAMPAARVVRGRDRLEARRAATAEKKARMTRTLIPTGYAGDGVGSWLSEVTEKVVGEKTAKSWESGIKKNTASMGGTAAGIASLIPGIGPGLSKGITMLTTASAMGQDPKKMSWETINTITAQDPVLGAQLAEQKRAYESEKLTAKQTKQANKQARKARKMGMAGMAAPAPAPAPAKSNAALIIGGLALAGLLMMKGK
jgi:hypothetical protein